MKKRIVIIFLIVLLLFIWGNSCLPQNASSRESGWVMALLRPIFEAVLGKDVVTEHFVRKLAHFTEYAALGCVSVLWLTLLPIKMVWCGAYSAMGCLMVALLDETIQIFSGRGPMIQDVWLDFGGAVCGGGIVFLICYLAREKKRSTCRCFFFSNTLR